MRRRLAFLLAAVLVAILVGVAALPWWLGAAARGFGPSRGLTFGGYERIGYARFALRDVTVTRGGVRVTATRAEADTPVLWWWRHWRGNSTPVVVERWQVEVSAPTAPRPPNPDRGWMDLRARLQRIAMRLDQWLPRASVGAGLVRWPTGEISLQGAAWEKRELAVTALAFRALTANATVSWAEPERLRATALSADRAFALAVESRGAEVSGQVTLWEQPATLRAAFAPRGWLPAEASLDAANWAIAGDKLKLGPLYAHVRGSALLAWRDDRIRAELDARGEPIAGKPVPPLSVVARAQGDGRVFTIESLQATLPGINAQLTAPLTVDRSGKIQESGARFAFDADLARQPWLAAKGTVKGEARVLPGPGATPVVDLVLEARSLVARDVDLAAVTAQGRLDWPRLQIAAGTIAGGEGERLRWRGGWDFRTGEVLEAEVEGEVRRAALARWLPPQPGFDVVKIQAHAAGRPAELAHRGRAEAVGVAFAGVKPLAVSVAWRGQGAAIPEFDATASAGATRVRAGGAVGAKSLTLTRLEFEHDGATRLQLSPPATVQWRPLLVSPLRLAGPAAQLHAATTLGASGRVEVTAHGVPSRWLADLVALRGPAWQVDSLALVGRWNQGPMEFTLTAGAWLELAPGRRASVMVSARGDQTGVRVEALRALEGDATVVNATGRLPLTLSPGSAPLLRIDPNGAIAVDATVAPHAAFWQHLAALTGVELQEPAASAHLTGTWQRPQGDAQVKAARVAFAASRFERPLPTISQLEVKITGQPSGLALEKFSVAVEGQPVRAQGRLPVPDGQWTQLFRAPLAAARRGADLRVEVPEADVAVFARFLPAVLAPKGRLQADLHYKAGGVEGFLKLRDAATRPLGPLGVLQEISADIALSGRKLALRGVTARSGGQPVTLSGTIELPAAAGSGVSAPQPRFDLALRGENLPFVRQTGLLVRGDLDLQLQSPPTAATRLSGTVRLRDSLFLSDVRSFLPRGGAGPTRRPPYFAVETAPASGWLLAVDVVGDRFLRLRTPVFAGVASAHFRLSGTLGEPRAIGEVSVEEGRVRMPFAAFEVQQASVRLTEADPYEPIIYLRGTARRYEYDLTMEIDGKAAGPNVTFTSSPALDSEQVLLMVMTGAAPREKIARSTSQRLAGVGYFLGQSLVGNLLGTSDDEERLTFTSGEKVTRQSGKETYEVEYKLSDRWTLTAERSEFDEINAGVKWRILGGKREPESKGDGRK